MCSKCHKDVVLKEEQARLAQTSIKHIVNGGGSSSSAPVKEHFVDIQLAPEERKAVLSLPPTTPMFGDSEVNVEGNVKAGPSRCTTCKKGVGLTEFKCHCGNLLCESHRYFGKHDCPFDYHAAGKMLLRKPTPSSRRRSSAKFYIELLGRGLI